MKDQYVYTTDELKEVVNELIVWRDGLELMNNWMAKSMLKRIDLILDLKKIEDNPITKESVGYKWWEFWK